MSDWIERPKRTKGSGDHRWAEWKDTPLGRGRTCLDCGCEDDGYVQPCLAYTVDPNMLIVCPLCGAETAQSAHHVCPAKEER